MKKSWHEHRKVAPREQRTSSDGILFHSKTEMLRWEYLKLLQKARTPEISGLERQVRFDLCFENKEGIICVMAGTKTACYTADFVYFCHKTNQQIIEDVKGYRDEVSKLRIRVFEAVTGNTVQIIKKHGNGWIKA